MKVEVAPWIRDYVVDMDELYTELTLQSLVNKSSGLIECKLDSYNELFVTETTENVKRVLLKSDPGIGKSTLCKKIAYDWAKSIFNTFTVVFLIVLKFVKPGDTVENSLMKQYPNLKIDVRKLRSLLEEFGGECLLILDGLDEHALGRNHDVLRIIQKQKYPNCNVLLTSRPHSVREIEKYFEVIVRVDGFTRQEAKKFVTKIVREEKKVECILQFRPVDLEYDTPLYSKPILLSFLCLLVREGEDKIDLLKDSVHVGEIYTRMVRCLYKKFTIRADCDYREVEFVEVVTKVGKIAFQTLLSGNPLLKKGDVLREVGPEAFDYGLLIGHEDFRLLKDESADIFVTFPHQSFIEFLGAFYFIQALIMKTDLNSLRIDLAEPLFMTNLLFLHFCLWFLNHSKSYFDFENVEYVHDILQKYILSRIDTKSLRFRSVVVKYPALNIEEILQKKDRITSNFFGDVLTKCNNVRVLQLVYPESLDWVLTCMRQVLPLITCIVNGNVVISRVHEILTVQVRGNSPKRFIYPLPYHKEFWLPKEISLRKLYGNLLHFRTDLSVEIKAPIISHLSQLNHPNIKKLSLCGDFFEAEIPRILIALPPFVNLQQLSFVFTDFIESAILNLSEAQRDGNLPCLTHLSFTCCDGLQSNLSKLFSSIWPHLTHLGFDKCDLNVHDLKVIGNMKENHVPNLSSLTISINSAIRKQTQYLKPRFAMLHTLYLSASNVVDIMNLISTSNLKILKLRKTEVLSLASELFPSLFSSSSSFPFQNLPLSLESLILDGCVDNFKFLTGKNLPTNLKHLEIRYSEVTKKLSALLCHRLSSLHTLILRGLQLDSQDLSNLAQANVENRLPQLKHLDISDKKKGKQ